MPRRADIAPRAVLPDPVYGNMVVTKLINQVMRRQKGIAQRVCYDAFNIVQNKTGRDPIEVFEQAINNIMPVLEVKAAVGGSTYQFPSRSGRAPPDAGSAAGFLPGPRRADHEREAGRRDHRRDSGGGNAVKRKEDMRRMAEPTHIRALSLVRRNPLLYHSIGRQGRRCHHGQENTH